MQENSKASDLKELTSRRVAKILPAKDKLINLLRSRQIRVYQGFDATAPRLHLGHIVGLKKLMEFAALGHEVIFLFGTGTVLVGDPSLRDSQRKIITEKEIEENIQDWQRQVSPIVDFNKVTIRKNADWLMKLTLKELIDIASKISAVQLFKREMFQRRLEQGDTVWFHETMYPLLQGYDSVVLDVDLEIGGTDQEFNMLIGRELQAKMNHKQKFVLTVPMIMGTDAKPMSKTAGNCIWLSDSAPDMYGKLMSISDDQIQTYLELLTDIPTEEIRHLPDAPFVNKKRLAFEVTKTFHGEKAAQNAQNLFRLTTTTTTTLPYEIPVLELAKSPLSAFDICKIGNFGASHSEIKRTIEQGGVEINRQKITDSQQLIAVKNGDLIKYGKRLIRQIKLKAKP